MRNTRILNQHWWFQEGEHVVESFADLSGLANIEIPHNAKDTPFNYFDESMLHRSFTYHHIISCDQNMLHDTQVINFEGVLANAVVYVNGQKCTSHSDGYTPFDAVISRYLTLGDNLITVTIDGAENEEIPPFGGAIDYICYPGIYRNVSLTSYNAVRIQNVKASASDVLNTPSLQVTTRLQYFSSFNSALSVLVELLDPQNKIKAYSNFTVNNGETIFSLDFDNLTDIELWDTENPVLYQVRVTIVDPNIKDIFVAKFGFRDINFSPDGFYLNGKRLQLVGVNRHQSYPYVGYAMGERAQRLDADIIRNEYGFNMVRTSHYPQAPCFLDRCDELGLLVFEEIPGWQHIGDKAWQQRSLDNVKAMIERDWNHACIVIWGVRINESEDNSEFYQQSNALARELDDTRPTGGVRCIENSEFLEDVYTMNDFILGDGEQVLRDPRQVTGLDHDVPYLVTEYAGHMYPTKRYDCEAWQSEHVMRHLRVLNASLADKRISGAISWCLFDYNTHRDFGSGDKVCYHGISDMFRIPKFAADVYGSQLDPHIKPVLSPVTYWTRGERPEAATLPLIILTNCDRVEIKIGDSKSAFFYPDKKNFAHLSHPPIIIDHNNVGDFPLGGWGYAWSDVEFRGYCGQQVIISKLLSSSPIPSHLNVELQTTVLKAHCADSARVVIKALDQHGQILPYLDDILNVSTSDNLQLLGPSQLVLKGGAIGFWVRAYEAGEASICIDSQSFASKTLFLKVLD